MILYSILIYGIPVISALVSIYVGVLGYKFHMDVVVRGED